MGAMARREVLGDGTFGLRPTAKIVSLVLAANTEQHFNVPTDTYAAGVQKATMALFSGTADFYVGFDTTAIVPSVSVTDGTALQELNPTQRLVSECAAISVISAVTCIITITFYS